MPELERSLRDLGAAIAYPAEPSLAPAVTRRLRDEPPPRRLLWGRPRLAVVLAVVALALGAALAVEPARTALFDFFHIGGVTVERVDTLPAVQPNAPLGLGRRITLSEARRAVAFRVLVPGDAEAGDPDGVYLSRAVPGGAVSLLYGTEQDIRLLVTQFRGTIEPDLVKKATAGSRFSVVIVRGVQGYWLSGAPHAVVFRDARGQIRADRYRLAGNVLLWVEDGITYRLEGNLALPDARRVAKSMR